jgi:hypothetical protein
MDEVIQQRRKELFNLGLLNTIESYRHLLNARPTERSHKSYMEFFGRLYEGGIKDAATERMQQLQRLIQAKAEFTNKLPEALGKGKDEDHRTAFLRNDRDAITGTAQYLPTKPRIRSKKYEGILRAILDYYKTPPQGSEEKAPLIDDAYKAFIEIDTDVNRLDPEHELIRCLLYMAFPRVTGDRQAYDYAAELLINKELMAAQPGIEQEYIYVICWAARRLKEYSTAHYYAELGIRNWPDDPRFYHGRCLNTAAWLGDEKKEAECRLTLRDAIEDARRALDLYGRDGEESRDLIGACYNNLAYLWAEYAARESCTAAAVTEARRALLGLKEWTEKERWVPNHPEYLHTEAYVEFQEYSLARIGREDEARLRAKLEHARREIDKALALVKEKPLYDKLKREIDKALTRYASEP